MKDQMVRVAKEFAADESGVGVVEMILILVVLIGLVIIFKKQSLQKKTLQKKALTIS